MHANHDTLDSSNRASRPRAQSPIHACSMSAGPKAKEQNDRLEPMSDSQQHADKLPENGNPSAMEDEADDNDSDGEEEEPRLKYSKLTGALASVYRNGDATSAFLIAGDKMVLSTLLEIKSTC